MAEKTVLLVGATGFLGRKVAQAAHDRGYQIKVLLRSGSNASGLAALNAEIVTGDMRDMPSLVKAMSGCDAVIATAAGYTGHKKGDFNSTTDTDGYKNLARAAKQAKISRFVLCSVLTCDQAQIVPHFWHKKLAEDALESEGVPFIAVRPGGFIDQGANDFWAKGIAKGKLNFLSDPSIKSSFVHPDDVAGWLAEAVEIETDNPALRIDVGCDRAVSIDDMAAIMTGLLGRPTKSSVPPWPIANMMLRIVGMFKPLMADMRLMMIYFRRGTYVADTRLQTQYFGPPPTIESRIERYLRDSKLLS